MTVFWLAVVPTVKVFVRCRYNVTLLLSLKANLGLWKFKRPCEDSLEMSVPKMQAFECTHTYTPMDIQEMDVATIQGSGQGGGPGWLPHCLPELTTLQTTLLGDSRNVWVCACKRDIKATPHSVPEPLTRHRWPWSNTTADTVLVGPRPTSRETQVNTPTAMSFIKSTLNREDIFGWCVQCVPENLAPWLWSLRFNWTNTHRSHSLHHLPLSHPGCDCKEQVPLFTDSHKWSNTCKICTINTRITSV